MHDDKSRLDGKIELKYNNLHGIRANANAGAD